MKSPGCVNYPHSVLIKPVPIQSGLLPVCPSSAPEIRHEWYEKDSDTVTGAEFSALLRDFDAKLIGYSEIYFYYNPARFHPIYALLLAQIKLADRVKRITHLWEIT